MKDTASLAHIWGTRICTAILIGVAFYAGRRWRQLERSAEPPPVPLPSAASVPPVSGPASLSAGPDAMRVTADFEPVCAMVVGASELVHYHRQVLTELAREFDREQLPLILLVSDAREKGLCEEVLRQSGIPGEWVFPAVYPLNTMWVRDFGPLFAVRSDHTLSIVDASYTSNEDKAENRWRDDELPIVLSEALKLPLTSMPLRMEGGNLLSNGEGYLLTTTEVIFKNRSRGYGLQQVMTRLKHYLAAGQWSYVRPMYGESTGHVDMFVTLLRPDLAVVSRIDPAIDPRNAALLDEAASFVARIETSCGPMQVHRVPMPPPSDGFFRSHTNLILANNLVLVPVFADVDPDLQEEALELFRQLLPEKRVVGIPADSLVNGNGLLRCISFGLPVGVEWERLLSWDLDADEE